MGHRPGVNTQAVCQFSVVADISIPFQLSAFTKVDIGGPAASIKAVTGIPIQAGL